MRVCILTRYWEGGREVDKVFVFGSNQAGRHGAGAAAYAHKSLGAEWGVGEGPTGNSYAITTKDTHINSLPVSKVRQAVDRFIMYANENPEINFQVTRIGCGLAGFTDETIAPMFVDAPNNCEFDSAWKQWLPSKKIWGTF
jgi:hypothetical protein